MTRISVPILMYHSISSPYFASAAFRVCTVPPETFREHVRTLVAEQYTTLTVSQFVASMRSGADLPPKPVVLTFDDAYADFYVNAFPLLQQHGLSATLYVPTAFVGGTSRWLRREGEAGRPLLNWAQLAQISAAGIECGAHSFSHRQLDTLAPGTVCDEVTWCKRVLEEQLRQPVSSFAYPFGYYNATARQLVIEAGYTSACAVKRALSSTGDDPFALARAMVVNDTDAGAFRAILAGRGLPVAPFREPLRTRMRGVLRRGATRLERRLHFDSRAPGRVLKC
ncbi:MAG: polysaccharide deacetylase family protein [Chloroflexota bacterium]|nr:polysaccharide deacetylase family protein [Chloroflexota bacterium]